MTKPRRGKGEGTVYQKAGGRWCAQVDVGRDAAGRRIRKSLSGKTKTEVLKKKRELQQRVDQGSYIEESSMRVCDFMARWLDHAKLSLKPNTVSSYTGLVKNHINPRFGHVRLAKLTPLMIQRGYCDMASDNASPRMRELVHVVLRRALDLAVKWGLLFRNPTDAVTKPKAPKKPIMPLSRVESISFLEAAKSERLYALFYVAISTGMCQGELFGLQWRDVNFELGTIHIQRNLVELKGKHHLDEPKTKSARRTIKLTGTALVVLREHRKRMLAAGTPGPQVFCDTAGGFLRKSNVCRGSFMRILKLANLRRIRFHDLRHTAATLMLLGGVNPKVVQEALGHSDVSTTLNTYSHVLPSMQDAAADVLEGLLEGGFSQIGS